MTHDVATSQTNSLMVSSRDLVPPSEQRWVWPFIGPLPFIGSRLTVPPGWYAILTYGQGQRQALSEGRHRLDRYAPWGLCQVQYVDMRTHLTPIPSVKSQCRDGWEGELALAVYWRVSDALLIANVVEPGSSLSAAAQASMRAVIEMMSHNAFAAGMGDSVIRAEELALAIATRLKHNPAIQGIEVINVFVTDRRGDRRCIEIVNDSAALSGQMELHRHERKFRLLQAETNRLEEEERSQARIREAEIETEVDKQLALLKQREIERERAAAASQQRHEQTLKMIEAQGQVLSKVAEFGMLESLDDSTRRRPEQAGNSMETILQGLSGLQNMVQDPDYILGLGAGDLAKRMDLWTRLLPEIYEINQVEGVQKCRLTSDKDHTESRVVVILEDNKLVFTCGPEYPQAEPIVLQADNGQERKVVKPWWPEGASLKEIVEAFPARTAQADSRRN